MNSMSRQTIKKLYYFNSDFSIHFVLHVNSGSGLWLIFEIIFFSMDAVQHLVHLSILCYLNQQDL